MSTGVGIAIAGVWVFAAAGVFSKHVSGAGTWICIIIAALVTGWLK